MRAQSTPRYMLSRFRLTCSIAQWLLYSGLGAAVIADFEIAVSLCVLFYRGRTGYSPYVR